MNTDVLRASETQNHSIYKGCFKTSGSKKNCIYGVFRPVPSKNTFLYAVFTMLQDSFSMPKVQPHCKLVTIYALLWRLKFPKCAQKDLPKAYSDFSILFFWTPDPRKRESTT